MHDEEFLDLFKPKDQRRAPSPPEPQGGQTGDAMGATQPSPAYVPPPDAELPGVADAASQQGWGGGDEVESPFQRDGSAGCTWRMVGMAAGGGCLLLILLAVLVFALSQFWPRGEDDDGQATLTPTRLAVPTPPATTIPVTESPLVVPLVSSGDVRVPIAVPEHLTIGEATFTVEAARSPSGDWPDAPAAGDVAAWAYGTVVNYILRLSPTPENETLLSELQVGDLFNLHMSTGLILNFNVNEITNDITDSATLLRQASPRLTLALFPGGGVTTPTVASAAFYDDETSDQTLPTGAVAGLVGTPVDQGPVRVTVLEAYQVAAAEAGLPGGTGYLLVDLAVENIGTAALETEYFQSFVSDAAGERYPLTIPAGQFTHYGLPVAPLAPGEKVIGSAGYLVPDGPGGQVHWAFNP
ncbi:MAG: hypothetical protein PVF45_05710, partial [Anaerolineae bacterium]